MKNIHQSYFVVLMCVGIILGMIVGVVFRINFFASPIWIGFVTLVFILVYLKPNLLFAGLALMAGVVLAFFRIAGEFTDLKYIEGLYGQTVIVSGTVDGDPNNDEKGTKVKITNLEFGEGETQKAEGSIFVSLRSNNEIQRSDTVVLNGKLEKGFGTYAGYMYQPKIVKILKPEPGDLILKVRNWFAGRIKNNIGEPQVNLGLSYLLGMKTGLPEELSDNLRMVGLVHIVVASGTHLSILVEIAKKIFGKLSRFSGLMFSVIFIVFFMAMVGWTPSIMRAGIMSILTLLAWYVGRKFDAWRIIILVGALTLMIEPMFLINLGWLLSFASFIGIMILSPMLVEYFYGDKTPGFIAETIIVTISATLLTLPITLYYYGTVSLISVVANLLILPTLPYAMGLVFLSGVVSGIPLLETGVGFIATKMLDFHIAVVEFFGGMKSFVVEIEPYEPKVFMIYILIGLVFGTGFLWKRMIKLKQIKDGRKNE